MVCISSTKLDEYWHKMQRIFIMYWCFHGEVFMGELPQSPIRRQGYTPIALYTIKVDCEIQNGGCMTLLSTVFNPHSIQREEAKTTE